MNVKIGILLLLLSVNFSAKAYDGMGSDEAPQTYEASDIQETTPEYTPSSEETIDEDESVMHDKLNEEEMAKLQEQINESSL